MKSLNFTKQFQNSLLGKLFFLGLLMTSSILSAQVFNVNFAPLNFSANNQSLIPGTGTLNTAGSQVLYTNVITVDGQVMDCIVTNMDGTSGSSEVFDQNWSSSSATRASGIDSMFSPALTVTTPQGTGSSAYKRFKFEFVTKFGSSSTYSPVTLDNVVLNIYDIDREGSGNLRNSVKISKGNYNSFETFSTSTAYNNTDPNFLSFYSSVATGNTNTTYAGIVNNDYRYRFTFSNLISFEISLGAERTANNGPTTDNLKFFLAFSKGTAFIDPPILANIVVDLNTNDPSVNNTVEITNNNAYNFTVGSQNITLSDPQNLTSRINGINVTYNTADIINNNSESLIINGGNLNINLSNPNNSTCTLNSIIYTLNVSLNSGSNTLRFTANNGTDTMTRVQAETLLDAMQYKNSSIQGTGEIGYRNFTVIATGTYISGGITYALLSPPAIFIANITVPLPVKIARFVGKAVAQTNVLEWDVTEEFNFSHYEIYRSGNGAEYFPLGKIYATGDFNGFKKYAFVDNNPLASINYYKLKLVDNDGNATWSNSIFVNRNIILTNQVTLFPNPSHAVINVNLLDIELNSYTVTVQDLQGKVVLTQVVNDYQTNNLSLDIRGLDHGVYILKISDENGLVSVNRFSKN
ncbi:MAG: T9SS type A sorting domain-containing protein [Bacteroidota bacterium]|nr:T9SS type A sorting domain-containing protein [Bacteroidota bacterium]